MFKVTKHKGKTFQEVLSSDPSFCIWALGLDEPSNQVAAFVDWLRQVPSRYGQKMPDATALQPHVKAVHRQLVDFRQQPLLARKTFLWNVKVTCRASTST